LVSNQVAFQSQLTGIDRLPITSL